MEVNIQTVISIVAVVVAAMSFLSSRKDKGKQDASQYAGSIATISAKLDMISANISELKADLRSQRDDINDIRERLALVEKSAESAHQRIDDIKTKMGGN